MASDNGLKQMTTLFDQIVPSRAAGRKFGTGVTHRHFAQHKGWLFAKGNVPGVPGLPPRPTIFGLMLVAIPWHDAESKLRVCGLSGVALWLGLPWSLFFIHEPAIAETMDALVKASSYLLSELVWVWWTDIAKNAQRSWRHISPRRLL